MSNRFVKFYNGSPIRVAYENGQVLFNLIDSSWAAGYAKTASLRHHTKGKNREVNLGTEGIFISAKVISKIAKDAINSKVAPYANWAKKITDEVLVQVSKPVKKVAPPKKAATTGFVNQALTAAQAMTQATLVGLKDAAKSLNMTVGELSDWLVAQGYAGRYVSNNSIFWKKWFKDQGYGKRPVIADEKGIRESNVAKLSRTGLEFVKARLESQRESNVLSFAAKESNERVKLEKEVDELIIQSFKPYEVQSRYSNLLGTENKYEMYRHELISSVKAIISQVKLKEKNGLQGSNL